MNALEYASHVTTTGTPQSIGIILAEKRVPSPRPLGSYPANVPSSLPNCRLFYPRCSTLPTRNDQAIHRHREVCLARQLFSTQRGNTVEANRRAARASARVNDNARGPAPVRASASARADEAARAGARTRVAPTITWLAAVVAAAAGGRLAACTVICESVKRSSKRVRVSRMMTRRTRAG